MLHLFGSQVEDLHAVDDLERQGGAAWGNGGRVVPSGLAWRLGRSVYWSAAVRLVPTGAATIGLTGVC